MNPQSIGDAFFDAAVKEAKEAFVAASLGAHKAYMAAIEAPAKDVGVRERFALMAEAAAGLRSHDWDRFVQRLGSERPDFGRHTPDDGRPPEAVPESRQP